MNVTIFTCAIGGGHNSTAAAIQSQLSAMGHTGIIHDALAFLPKSSAELISKGHNFAYRYAPKLYGVGYRFEEKHPPTIFYEQSAKGADELLRTLRTDGADAAICVHVFPAMMVTELRRRGQLSIPAYFVATDYTCSPGVGELDMDGFCIPHEALMDEFTSCGVKRSLLYATGIPVSPEFSQPMDRKALRHTLHLEDKRRILVLACGSMGAGPMRTAAEKLAQNLSTDDKLIMVCGSNRRLYRYSKLALAEYPQVQVVGFTKRMPQYLHVCDVLITKAGGLTTTEAVAAGVPLVYLNAVPGCETRNLEFMSSRGYALVAEDETELPPLVRGLLSGAIDPATMVRNREGTFPRHAAENICRMVCPQP